MAVSTEQEEALVRRVQNGDDAAFDRLVELCSPRVYSLALRMAGNPEDAQDIAQEAFVRVFQAIPRFRRDAGFSTWLYRIVANVCHDELKRRKRRPLLTSELVSEDGSSILDNIAGEDTPELTALRHERQQAIGQVLADIPEIYRLVVILHDVQGLQYQEIAEVTRANMGTVKSRLNRARNMLREKLLAQRELFGLELSQS